MMHATALLVVATLAFPTQHGSSHVALQTTSGTTVRLDADQLLEIYPVYKGDPAPFDGRVIDNASYVVLAQRLQAAEAERDALRAAPPPALVSKGVVIVLVTCTVLALAAGVYLGWEARSLKP